MLEYRQRMSDEKRSAVLDKDKLRKKQERSRSDEQHVMRENVKSRVRMRKHRERKVTTIVENVATANLTPIKVYRSS